MPDEQNIYYHYTSVETLYNIVKTRTFWLVNSKSSNDKTEGVLKKEEINRIIDLSRKDISDNEKEYFDEIFKDIKDYNLKNEYIFCLSKLENSLAHWDRYASFRKGVCIHIDIKKLNKYFDLLNSPFGQYFNIYELGYLDDELKKEVIRGFNAFQEMRKIDNRIETNKNIKTFFIKMTRDLICSSLCSKKKNPYFKDEKEMRISVSSLKLPDLRDTIKEMNKSEELKSQYLSTLEKFDIEKTYFAPIRGEIRSLHHLCLKDIWGGDLIPEIMLGPNCPQSKDELRYFLDEKGLKDTKITESKIPIR